MPPILQTLDSQWSLNLDSPADQELAAIPIPLGLYVVARDDLADVRILSVNVAAKAATEVPFAFVQRVDEVALHEAAARVTGPQPTADGTQFELDFGPTPQPVSEIAIDVDPQVHDYRREVHVFGRSRSEETEVNLTTAGLLYGRSHEAGATRLCHVRIPRGKYVHCRVVIRDGAEPPLPIAAVRAVDRAERRPARTDIPALHLVWSPDPTRSISTVEADLNFRNLPTTGVKLDIASTEDFCRTVTIETTDYRDRAAYWRSAGTFDLYRFTMSGGEVVEQTEVDYPAVRGGYVRITIQNRGERPLPIRNVTATSIVQLLVCERKYLRDPDRQVALYAGDRLRSAPEQVLTVSSTLAAKELESTVIVGPRQANPFKLAAYDPAALESQRDRDRTWNLTVGAFITLAVIAGVTVWRRAQRQEN